MGKLYRVTLARAERDQLEQVLARGKADVRRLKHAQMLLKADEAAGGPAWSDARITAAFDCGTATVERVRRRFRRRGLGGSAQSLSYAALAVSPEAGRGAGSAVAHAGL